MEINLKMEVDLNRTHELSLEKLVSAITEIIEDSGRSTNSHICVKKIDSIVEEEQMNLTAKIKQWAVDRNLHTANPDKQMLKLFEELGELAEGMAKDRQEQVADSIGDIYVVLTILSTQLGMDIEECIALAYDEIKDRRGKMIDGVFVKEADLVKDGAE